MQSPKGKLIDYNREEQQNSNSFPRIQQALGSDMKISKSIIELKQISENLEDLPEYFKIGGNHKLNEELFIRRKKKIEKLTDNIIQCESLGKEYKLKGENPVQALRSLTLKGQDSYGAIKKGEFVIIRGPSGGGKTTFLNLLGTIDSATSGTLSIDEHVITSNSKDDQLSKLRRERIGIVFQTFNLLALMSAYENIQLPMRIKGKMSQKEMKQRTKMLLRRVGLAQRAQHLPSQLSGGEQQRVAIARSLSNSPSIILLDEPTGDLDSKSTIHIMNLLLQINNFGYNSELSDESQEPITIVMVTHNEDLQCYGDRIIFFEDGTIKRQVLNQYQFALDPQEYSQFLNTKI